MPINRKVRLGFVYDQLKSDDEIVFDFTHAFRSIPMVAIVILNYTKVMKDIRTNGIYYGAFEVLETISEARGLLPEERRVPVLDLTYIFQPVDGMVFCYR